MADRKSLALRAIEIRRSQRSSRIRAVMNDSLRPDGVPGSFLREPAAGILRLLPGERLGPYLIVSELGAGAMGRVVRATDTRLGRDVALKLLPDSWFADEDRRARFDREARILAAISHPYIAALYG